jgi:hypothetical protein
MTAQHAEPNQLRVKSVAGVWIDHEQALVVGHEPDGAEMVDVLDRAPAESEAAFDARVIDEVIDEDRLLVAGPEFARIGFEREYVAVTHRPERLVDVER